MFYFFWLSIYYSSLLLIYKHFGFSSNMSFEHLSLCEGTVSEWLKYSCITRAHSSMDNNSQKLESCGSHRTTCKHLSRWTGVFYRQPRRSDPSLRSLSVSVSSRQLGWFKNTFWQSLLLIKAWERRDPKHLVSFQNFLKL